MDIRIPLFIAAALLAQPAFAATAYTSNHPEEAYPNVAEPIVELGPYDELAREVQRRLHAAGFDAGPINGDLGGKAQTALGQYQISQNIPASGTLDEQTLAALGVQRPEIR